MTSRSFIKIILGYSVVLIILATLSMYNKIKKLESELKTCETKQDLLKKRGEDEPLKTH